MKDKASMGIDNNSVLIQSGKVESDHERVAAIIARLVEDCNALGASEVFIGQPEAVNFECFAGKNHFSGRIPQLAFLWLLNKAKVGEAIKLDELQSSAKVSVKNLRLGLTRSSPRPIFCVSWTKEQSDDDSKEASSPAQENKSLRKVSKPFVGPPKVLLVEDDPRFLHILSKILEEHGFLVEKANHGAEALKILDNSVPQLIICDVHMPHLDGPALLLELKRREVDCPFIVLSGDEEALTEAEMVILGADAYIRKQEDPRILLAWCRRLTAIRAIV